MSDKLYMISNIITIVFLFLAGIGHIVSILY